MIPNVVHDPTGLQVSFEDFDLSLGTQISPRCPGLALALALVLAAGDG